MNAAARRPNIVVVLADDMGFSDIGCFGSEIATPALDRLSSRGLRFSQMYNCARCCPSRATLLTGLYPHQAGIGGMVGNGGSPAYQGYLRSDAVTIAELLQAGGYRTILSGKWHVGGEYSIPDPQQWRRDAGTEGHPLPTQRGFERYYGMLCGAGSYYNPPTLMHDDRFVPPDEEEYYFTDAVTDHAIREVDRAVGEEKPFFLYLAYTAPHWPLHAFPADIERYRRRYGCGWDEIRHRRHYRLREEGILEDRWPLSPRDPDATAWQDAPDHEWEDLRMATYAAQIDRMDQNIGRLVERLEHHQVFDNTLIVFLSDNGGCAEFLREDGETGRWPEFYSVAATDGRPVAVGNSRRRTPGGMHTFMSYDLPWANASNSPFRLYKSWAHEGGIATPMIVSWPERLRRTGICHQPAHLIDFMPTFLEAAGIEYPQCFGGREIQPCEGTSLMPLLTGEGDYPPERMFCWEHYTNRAIRLGNWKLVSDRRNDDRAWELYEIEHDRVELNNLIDRHADVAERLATLYEEWRQRVGAH